MKTLKDHTIFYDADCPMCCVYTKAFVDTQMLDEAGRAAYQEIPDNFKCTVNMQRAVNEIALVNRKTGQVEYGVRSLFIIIQNRFPMLKSLFNSQLFFWFADKAYKFVSYNRRVIVPSGNQRRASIFNEPYVHPGYRLLYLVITWLITASVLFTYSKNLQPLLPASSFYREFLICGGQIFWQLAFIQAVNREKSWDYLGNLMTVSFAGGLALLLVHTFGNLAGIDGAHFYLISFGLVVTLMFFEHIRRTRLLGLNWIMTAAWVAYRIILLFFIF